MHCTPSALPAIESNGWPSLSWTDDPAGRSRRGHSGTRSQPRAARWRAVRPSRVDRGRRVPPLLCLLRWELIPGEVKEPTIGHRLINARTKPAEAKRAVRAALTKRRCLMAVDGFRKWRREGGVRPPWLIARRDGGLMAYAALRER